MISLKKIETPIDKLLKKIISPKTPEEISYLVNKYYNLTLNILQVKNSIYKNIPYYNAYVYLITNKLLNKYYIGVRYTKEKFSNNLLEDLKHYKSSSTDILFKEDLENNPENYTFSIIQSFKTEFEALNFEALIHNIYNVDTNKEFYNISCEQIIDSKIYTQEIECYDIDGNKILLSYSNKYEICSKYNIDNKYWYYIIKGMWNTVKNLLFINYDTYISYTKQYILYYYNDSELVLYTYSLISDKYINNALIKVAHNALFYNGTPLDYTYKGIASNKKLAGQIITKNYDFLSFKYINRDIYLKFYYYEEDVIKYIYMNYDMAKKYITDKYANLSVINMGNYIKKEEIFTETPLRYSIDGYYYINKEELIEQNKSYTLYFKKDNNIQNIVVKNKELNMLLGDNCKRLLNHSYRSVNGYSLTPEYASEIKTNNKNIVYIGVNIYTNESIYPLIFNSYEDLKLKFGNTKFNKIKSRNVTIWEHNTYYYYVYENDFNKIHSKYIFEGDDILICTIPEFCKIKKVSAGNVYKIFNSIYDTKSIKGYIVKYLNELPVYNTNIY